MPVLLVCKLVSTKEAVVALGIFTPPFFHWYVSDPPLLVTADTCSVCEVPTQSVLLLAEVWTVGALFTTSTAALLVTLLPQLFDTTTL